METVMLLGYGPQWTCRTLDDLVILEGWRIAVIAPWWCEARRLLGSARAAMKEEP